MVLAAYGVVTWIVHAIGSVSGRRRRFWLLAWAAGLPMLCLLDYAVLALAVPRPGGGIDRADTTSDQLVVNLFVGVALWVLLLVLEPVLLLVDAGVRRRRARAV